MNNQPQLKVDDDEAVIEFPAEGMSTNCPVTRVGRGLFRLDGVPFASQSAAYKDVIEAEEVGAGRLRFRRVAQAGGWRVHDYLLPRGWLDSDSGKAFLAELGARGVHWELVFGGMLFVCVPPGLTFDPTRSFQAGRT